MAEDSSRNLLYVAISEGAKGIANEIEIYDINKEQFKLIHTIKLKDIIEILSRRMRNPNLISNLAVAFLEILKIDVGNKEDLKIALSNGSLFYLSITVKEEKLLEAPPKKVCTFTLVDVITPQVGGFLAKYEDSFELLLSEDIQEHFSWKPLPARSMYLSSKIDPYIALN